MYEKIVKDVNYLKLANILSVLSESRVAAF